MFTYLQQQRTIRFESSLPDFPASATVEVTFGPGQLFGVEDGPLRAVRLGSDLHVAWDANCDRTHNEPRPRFSRVELEVAALDGTFAVLGNVVKFAFAANSVQDVQGTVQFLLFALPACLNESLPDPVTVRRVTGTVGTAQFRVEHRRTVTPIVVLDDEHLKRRVADGISKIDMLATSDGVRLLAASRYIHVASRLLATGQSPWEFMAESILNFAKSLEVLFGDSRDEQREGLRAIGVPDSDIDARYIPVTLLRDFLDVAHPRLAQLDGARLQGIYQFLIDVEGAFKEMLGLARTAIVGGRWAPSSVTSQTLGTRDLATVDRIIQADVARAARERESRAAGEGSSDA